MTEDARWLAWSAEAIEHAADRYRLVINPVIYAEVSIRYSRIEDLDAALPKAMFDREAHTVRSRLPRWQGVPRLSAAGRNKELAASGLFHRRSRGCCRIFADDKGCSAISDLFPQALSDRAEWNFDLKIGLWRRHSAHHRRSWPAKSTLQRAKPSACRLRYDAIAIAMLRARSDMKNSQPSYWPVSNFGSSANCTNFTVWLRRCGVGLLVRGLHLRLLAVPPRRRS